MEWSRIINTANEIETRDSSRSRPNPFYYTFSAGFSAVISGCTESPTTHTTV